LKNPTDESFISGILQSVGFSRLLKELSFQPTAEGLSENECNFLQEKFQ
jgi:hypothetical protein